MTAYYDTLIVTFSDPIRILDMMCTDTCDVATLKEWIESSYSGKNTPTIKGIQSDYLDKRA